MECDIVEGELAKTWRRHLNDTFVSLLYAFVIFLKALIPMVVVSFACVSGCERHSDNALSKKRFSAAVLRPCQSGSGAKRRTVIADVR